jgi:hypothetical protein
MILQCCEYADKRVLKVRTRSGRASTLDPRCQDISIEMGSVSQDYMSGWYGHCDEFP